MPKFALSLLVVVSISSITWAQGIPQITVAMLPKRFINQPYSASFTVASGTGTAPFTWSVVPSGPTQELPRGMSLSSLGLYSGTPTVPGQYSFTVRVSDAAGLSSTRVVRHLITSGPPTVVPGFDNNRTGTPGEMLWRLADTDRITNIVYHSGFLFTNQVGAGDPRRWRWTNPNDVTTLTWQSVGAPATGQGNHAHVKSGEFIGGDYRFPHFRSAAAIEATGFIGNTSELSAGVSMPSDFADLKSGMGLYWPFEVEFFWTQYSGADPNRQAFLKRNGQTLASWPAIAQSGVLSTCILLGNRMFIVSDETAEGVTSWDLDPVFQDPPQPPVLLSKLSGDFGAYLAVPYRDKIILTRGNRIEVVDISDPTDLKLFATMLVVNTPGWHQDQSVPYAQIQDEFLFARAFKWNLETLQPVLEFNEVGGSRPGSIQAPAETSQYMLPLGNLLVTTSYSTGNANEAMAVWVHQATPDRRAPFVGYHIPANGQTNYPIRAPISVLIHETLESFTIINGETVLVQPVLPADTLGPAVDCLIAFSHDDVLTITPMDPLELNTTYQVTLTSGIKDAANNGLVPYSFRFSTGSGVVGNRSPIIASLVPTPGPADVGQNITFTATASDPDGNPLEYRYNLGDGTIIGWTSAATANHAYSAAGHYPVTLQVRDGQGGVTTASITVTAANAIAGVQPTRSGKLALNVPGTRVWTVDPDNDSAALLNATTGALVAEFNLRTLLATNHSVDPRNVAVDSLNNAWITCHDLDVIAIVSEAGALVAQIQTGYGSSPFGVCATPDRSAMLVSLQHRAAGNPLNGQLVRYRSSDRVETGRLELPGPMARAIAITGTANRALVSRFISPEHWGEIWDVSIGANLTLTRTIRLRRDRGSFSTDNSSSGAGVPNYISGITISPNNQDAWYTAYKSETNRGGFFARPAGWPANRTPLAAELTPDHTVRALVGRISLSLNREPRHTPSEGGNVDGDNLVESPRIDVDNSEGPTAVVLSPRNDYLFTSLQGNDDVAVFDLFQYRANTSRAATLRLPAGAAPQDLLFVPASNRLFIKNLLSRDVTVYDITPLLAAGARSLTPTTTVTSTAERLSPSVLRGKQLFYRASDAMNLETYMSCASCHVDGMHDGRTFDFTQRGEGLRNTTDLRGRAGTGHGNVHWTGNFDEIQDFILDIRNHFGGAGFLNPGDTPNPSLGAPNAGRNQDLDDLAAYVSSLAHETIPRSPFRTANGSFTADAIAGAALFTSQNCISCHAGPNFTDSTVGAATLHNVGTLRTSSGSRLGALLTGMDTPSLLGVWTGAPYLHDGSAATLDEVFTTTGGIVLQAEFGTFTGGAREENFFDINGNASAHGNIVVLQGPGARVSFNNVTSTAAGIGMVEVRALNYNQYIATSTSTLRLIVNGVPLPTTQVFSSALFSEYRRVRFTNVPLNLGSNTIAVEYVSGTTDPMIDEIMFSTPSELALASAAHAVSLTTTERNQLVAYIRSLDSSASNTVDSTPPALQAVRSRKTQQ